MQKPVRFFGSLLPKNLTPGVGEVIVDFADGTLCF